MSHEWGETPSAEVGVGLGQAHGDFCHCPRCKCVEILSMEDFIAGRAGNELTCFFRALWVRGLQDLSRMCVKNELIFQINSQNFQYLQDVLGSDLSFLLLVFP